MWTRLRTLKSIGRGQQGWIFSQWSCLETDCPVKLKAPGPEHFSSGWMTSSKACCERIQVSAESWIGGPWKSLPALRVCNSTAAKPLQ